MYDKVKLMVWAERGEFQNVASSLEHSHTDTDNTTGEMHIWGSYKGLKVSVYPDHLFITGSLAKYYFGHNVETLTRAQTEEAINKMSEDLGINLNDAEVKELEFGANFKMSRNVKEYLGILGECPRLARLKQDNSVYFQGRGKAKPKKYVFYDKGQELIDKSEMPFGYNVGNLLRFEVRYKGRLPHQLDTPEVKASTLYDEAFYRSMVQRYLEAYNSISKHKEINVQRHSKSMSPKQIANAMFSMMWENSTLSIEEALTIMKQNNVTSNRKNYCNARALVKRIVTQNKVTVTDRRVKELNKKIEDLCKMQMSI